MPSQDTREGTPPAGGIFLFEQLAEQLAMPVLIEELIRELPNLQAESQTAQQELNDMFQEDPTRSPAELSPYAQYLKSVREFIGGFLPDDKRARVFERMTQVEGLKERAARYQDAQSAIRQFGESNVTILLQLGEGLHSIGGVEYEISVKKHVRYEHEVVRFHSYDTATGQTVYFNRWDAVPDETTERSATLADYVQLLDHVLVERASRADTVPVPVLT